VHEDGVLVGSVTIRESEWDDDQRALMLAHLELEADIGPHGQPMSEATSPLANPSDPKRAWVYEGRGPVVDYAAQAIDKKREAYKALLPKDSPMPAGLLFRADKVDL
jgi:hypothetical protein